MFYNNYVLRTASYTMKVHMALLNRMFDKLEYDAILRVMSKLTCIDSFAAIFGVLSVLTLACFKVRLYYLQCSQ